MSYSSSVPSPSVVAYAHGALQRVAALQHAVAGLPADVQPAGLSSFSADFDAILAAAADERRMLYEWRSSSEASVSAAARHVIAASHRTLCDVGSGLWNFVSHKKALLRPACFLELKALAAELLLTGRHFFSPVETERQGLVSNLRVGIDTAMMACRVGKECLAGVADAAAAGLWLRRAVEIVASLEPRLPSPAAAGASMVLERFTRAKSELLLCRLQLHILEEKWAEVACLLRSALVPQGPPSHNSSSKQPAVSFSPTYARELCKLVLSGCRPQSPQQPHVQEALQLCIDYLHVLRQQAPAPPVSPRSFKAFVVALHEQAAISHAASGDMTLACAHARQAVQQHESAATLMLLLKSALQELSQQASSGPLEALPTLPVNDALAVEALFRLVQHPTATATVALTAIDLAWASGIGDGRPAEILQSYVLLLQHPGVASSASAAAQVRWRYAEALARLRRPEDLVSIAALAKDAAAALTAPQAMSGEQYGRWFLVALAGLAEEILEHSELQCEGNGSPSHGASDATPQAADPIHVGLELCRIAVTCFFMFGDALELSRISANIARLELVMLARSGGKDHGALQRAAAAAEEAVARNPRSPHAALVRFEALLLLDRREAARSQLAAMRRCEPHLMALDAFHVAAARALEAGHCELCYTALDALLGQTQNFDAVSSDQGPVPVETLTRVFVLCILRSEPSLMDTSSPADLFLDRCAVFTPKIAAAAALAAKAIAGDDESPRRQAAWWWATTLEALGRCIVHRLARDASLAALSPLVRELFEHLVTCLEMCAQGSEVAPAPVLRRLLASEMVFLSFAWAGNSDTATVRRHVTAAKALSRQLSRQMMPLQAQKGIETESIPLQLREAPSDGLQSDPGLPPWEPSHSDLQRQSLPAVYGQDEVDVLISVAEIEVALHSFALHREDGGAPLVNEVCSLLEILATRQCATQSHFKRIISCAATLSRGTAPDDSSWAELLFVACRCLVDAQAKSLLASTAELPLPQPTPSSEAWISFLGSTKNLLDLCPRRPERVAAACALRRLLLVSAPPESAACEAFLRYILIEVWNDMCYYYNLGEFGELCESLKECAADLVRRLPAADESASAVGAQLMILH
jgi:hypothetical protein